MSELVCSVVGEAGAFFVALGFTVELGFMPLLFVALADIDEWLFEPDFGGYSHAVLSADDG